MDAYTQYHITKHSIFRNKKKIKTLDEKLKNEYNLRLVYNDKRTKIYKNEDMILSCCKRFFTILFYHKEDNQKAYDIEDMIKNIRHI